MMLFKIAWRNIWRNPTRSLVIILAIAIGLWAAIFLLAFSYGMNEQRVREAINNEVSHFQVHHPHFKNNYAPKLVIPDGDSLLDRLKNEEQVAAVTWRAVTMGMIGSANTNSSVRINGIDPQQESVVTHLEEKVVEGSYFEESRNPVLISRRLARKLNVKLHSKVVLTMQDADHELVSGAFRVTGLYETNNSIYDESNVFVKGDGLQQLLEIGDGFHEIAVVLQQNGSLETLLAKYRQAYPELLFESWKQIMPEIEFMIDAFKQMMDIILFIVLLTLALGLANIMLMAVLERVREIGLLMAVGMNKVKVFWMIILETFCLSLAGSPAGILLGYFTVSFLGHSGIDLSFYAEGLSTFGYGNLVYPLLDTQYYFQIALEVFSITLIAAIFPAYKAVKLKPVEAIRKI
jgi:ABC-type lipoprotein release transport system permease subunit